MKIIDPIQLNDWDIRTFLTVVAAIQIAMLGTWYSDILGFEIPLIRQLIAFFYLTIIPGSIILRILKLHKLGNVETLIYSVSISISTLMIIGFFINTTYSFLNISRPISSPSIIIIFCIIIIILGTLSYFIDKDFSDPDIIDTSGASHSLMLLSLLPFLSVFGTYLMNYYQNNIILVVLIIVISGIFILVGFDKFLPEKFFPFSIFIISISLLYHQSLISMHLTGFDIQSEYYVSNLVLKNAFWNSDNPTSSINAMLSLVMFAPIYSIISNMDPTWIFKIIYPLLFSLVPIGLYRLIQKQVNSKFAILSSLYFMSILTFYTEMLQLARQEIAELFLISLILLLVDKEMSGAKRSFLIIVFSISLSVSHYGTSYIYMLYLLIALILLISMNKLRNRDSVNSPRFKVDIINNALNQDSKGRKHRTINLNLVLFFWIFSLAWYMYISKSASFNAIVGVGDNIIRSISTDFLNPEAAQGVKFIIKSEPSFLYLIAKILILISQFFISLGIIALIIKSLVKVINCPLIATLEKGIGQEIKFEDEYQAFSIISMLICFGCFAVPYFASALEVTRIFHLTLFFLAPFCILGFMTLLSLVAKVAKQDVIRNTKLMFGLLSIFLSILFLFNSGLIFEIAKDNPSSISLNNSKDYPIFNDKEESGAYWLARNSDSLKAYGDIYGVSLLQKFGETSIFVWGNTRNLSINVPIFLRSLNVEKMRIINGFVHGQYQYGGYIDIKDSSFFKEILSRRNLIFNNRGSKIYR